MTPNQVLSEKLKVQDLKGEEQATFVLLNVAKKEAGRETPSRPEAWVLAGQQDVTDPWDEQGTYKKTIQNVVGSVPVMERGRQKVDENGRPIMRPNIKSIDFRKGFVTVSALENPTYQYLMRRKDNLSNPFHKVMGGKKPIFKLVDDKKELTDILQHKELQYIAQKLVREVTYTDLKAIAMKMNESADQRLHVPQESINTPQNLKLEMIRKAESYPKFVINSSSDQASRVRAQIYECLSFSILRFDQGTYFLLGKEYKEIHKPDADKDPVDSLVDFFMKDKVGNGKYQDMAEALRKTLKA